MLSTTPKIRVVEGTVMQEDTTKTTAEGTQPKASDKPAPEQTPQTPKAAKPKIEHENIKALEGFLIQQVKARKLAASLDALRDAGTAIIARGALGGSGPRWAETDPATGIPKWWSGA